MNKDIPFETRSCRLCSGEPIAPWPPSGRGPTHHTCHPGEELETLTKEGRKMKAKEALAVSKEAKALHTAEMVSAQLCDVREKIYTAAKAGEVKIMLTTDYGLLPGVAEVLVHDGYAVRRDRHESSPTWIVWDEDDHNPL